MKIKKIVVAALLSAIAIIIPFAVVFKVEIPPFTATIGAHVPMFISMYFGPMVAVMVGLASALGFFLNLGPIVGARALMHIVVGLIGTKLLEKGMSFKKVAIITAPIHGLLEVLVILPFTTADAYNLFMITGVGTMLHHGVDAIIAYVIVRALRGTSIFKELTVAKV